MKHIYLLGYPLGHSVSPAMQNEGLAACGFEHWRYYKRALPPDCMEEMRAALRAPDCIGANVTIPYKQSILPFLDEVTETARAIGAVNTICKQNGRLVGENTDAFGFLQALATQGFSPLGERVVVLGAGGAGRAVTWALVQAGIAHLSIINRTPERAEQLARELRGHFPFAPIHANNPGAISSASLIVNATSAGMWPHSDVSPLDVAAIRPGTFVFDLVYNPSETRLMQAAAGRGARVIGGLEMLVYQGARALELWTGCSARVDVMRAAARAALEDGVH